MNGVMGQNESGTSFLLTLVPSGVFTVVKADGGTGGRVMGFMGILLIFNTIMLKYFYMIKNTYLQYNL